MAQSATIVTVTIAVTNTAGTTNGQTLTVNSDVRTWTNNVVTAASQILTNSTQSGAAFNLLSQVALHPFNALQTFQSGLTNIVLRGTNNFTITATVSAGWATVSYVTNTVATAIVYRAPGAVEPAAQQTNLASDIAFQLSTSTNPITLNTSGTNDFGHTILDDPASASFLQKRASDGLIIGTFNGTPLTNSVNWQTADYAASLSDTYILISAAHKVTMPDPAAAGTSGKFFWIQLTTSGTNAINPNGAETFNGNMGTGLNSLTNISVGKGTLLFSNGTNWWYLQL